MKNIKIDSDKVTKIFKTMEYGEVTEDTNAVKEWLNKRNNTICMYGVDHKNPIGHKKSVQDVNSGKYLADVYVLQTDDKPSLEKLLPSENSSIRLDSNKVERIRLMNKFALEIEQNSDFICKIESLTRGLLPKDTKKYGVALLVEYLRYFANWAYSSKDDSITYPGATVIYASDNTCLGTLGFALGPALAHECTVVLHVEPALAVCAAFLIELSIKAGFKEDVIKLLPALNGLHWVSNVETMVYLFGDTNTDSLKKLETYEKKQVVAVPNQKIPMLVFNNCDLDSACEYAISSVWEYGGMLPWATGTILIQEDVYPIFLEKMQHKLKNIRLGKGIDKLADISYPIASEIEKLERMISDARAQGIDIYQAHSDTHKFQPTLFVGMKVYNNNVIDDYKNVSPAVTILPFRTPKEAVALANNSRQGLAASVWSENVSLINEITRKLEVGTVWVNSHGIIKPNVPFTTHKFDGVGYIGGSPGYHEFKYQEFKSINSTEPLITSNLASHLKIPLTGWTKLNVNERAEVLSKWAETLSNNKSSVIIEGGVDTLIANIYQCITKYSSINSSEVATGFELAVKREPVGILVYTVSEQNALHIPVIVEALLLGNPVVLISQEHFNEHETFVKHFPGRFLLSLKCLPSVDNNNPHVVFINNSSAGHRFDKRYRNNNCSEFILRRCTLLKNIWIPVGDSL